MEEYAYNKIFVGGLHYDTRDAEFRLYFERFGRVMSAEVMFNRETHKSRGFGFIVFELESGAEQVCAEREHVIDGKVVEVKRAIPRSRFTPAGSVLSANTTPRPVGQPVRFTGEAYSMSNTHPVIGIANSKLRQDVRRSASVGNPSMISSLNNSSLNSSLNSSIKPAVVLTRPSLEASIAGIGMAMPRMKQYPPPNNTINSRDTLSTVSRNIGGTYICICLCMYMCLFMYVYIYV
jgi:RNA recognition motif-containing protein